MKRILVVFAGFSLLLAGLIPPTSAGNLPNTFALNTGTLFAPRLSTFQSLLKQPAQEGDLSTVANSGQTISKTGSAAPHLAKGTDTEEIPLWMHKRIREKQEANEKEELIVPVAQGPQARVGTISPEMPAPPMAAQRFDGQGVAPQAPNDMVIFRQHDMTSTEAPNSDRSNVHEPSVISVGNAIFYTANWYAARSLDGGQTFTYVNPYTTFPSINNGFCCDQVTAYAPNQNMALWGLQYSQDATSGTFRLARTIGSAGISSNIWTYYNFNPQLFGFASGHLMDFPNLTVSATYLYAAANVFRTDTGAFAGNVVWRVPLSELAAGGSINFSFITRTDIATIRLAENAGTRMYWAAFASNTQMRIHYWDDGAGTVLWDTINLNAFTYFNQGGVSNTADGRNWAARADSRPLGAYVSNGVIGVLWMAKQDAGFPQPYTIHARFSESTRALISQQQVWNSTFAWLYPNVAVNAAGNLGGVIAYGGGTGSQTTAYPHAAFWAIDDVSPNYPLGSNYLAITGNAGPAGNVWGDYLSVRRHSQYPNTWVAAVYALSGSTPVPRYIWFGRERDVSSTPLGRVVSDFDGDGKTDIAVFRQSNGYWYLQRSQLGFIATPFGLNGDRATPVDFDGDGKTDVAVFRPSNGTWYIQRSQLGFTAMNFGVSTDVPAVGDFDGDGKADIAVFRPSNGTWYIQRSQLGFLGFGFGLNGDIPVVGDYDGDGKSDIAVFRPSNGTWYIQRSQLGFTSLNFGLNGDKPSVGDYDGDGKADVTVFRPSNGTWYIQRSQLGFTSLNFGLNGDRPAPGDYDGDGKADIAVFRPSNGVWYIQRSQLGFFGQAFGLNGDTPAAGAYIP